MNTALGNRFHSTFKFIATVLILGIAHLAWAQRPNALLHSLPPPPAGVQVNTQLGHSVAVEAGYTAVGAPDDDTGGQESSGVVKVFSSATGALLFELRNPSPGASDLFGFSVAISGTRLVVGARSDDTGATNAGRAYVYDLGSAAPTVPVEVLDNPSPGADDEFGVGVGISGTLVVISAYLDDTGASDAGCVYVYDLSSVTPAVPVLTIYNPMPAAGDVFGQSVGVSGTRLVVGAPGNDVDSFGFNEGAAYFYELNSATPTVPVYTLNNPTPSDNYEGFGKSVAISGTRIVVGAYNDDTGATDSGSAYVYDVASSSPTSVQVTLNNPTPTIRAYFGWSVSISGSRVVIGSWADDTGATDAGSAYVYDVAGGTPATPVATLNNPSPASSDYFGWSVSLSGTRVAIGAIYNYTGSGNTGSAYVYNLNGGTPTVPVATLSSPGPAAGDQFGYSMAVSGTRIAVGAPFADTGGTAGIDAGIVYIFDTTSATPATPIFTLKNPSPAADDEFGFSVAISGTRVLVGTPNDDTTATDAGRAYVYDLSSGTPTTPVYTLPNPAPAASDNFGYAVSISGTRLVVGAYRDDAGTTNAGSAYVFNLSSGTPTVPSTTLGNPAASNSDFFGNAVAISGTRVVVAAYQDDAVSANSGTVYVYDVVGGTPSTPVATLNNPTPSANDQFGRSVAISGTKIVVGAFQDDASATDAGSAYVYDLASGTPTVPVVTLMNPVPAANDNFGLSVTISGTLVAVGAPLDDALATDAGTAYVYDLSGTTPTAPYVAFSSPNAQTGIQFGTGVALDGNLLAIGAPFDDSTLADRGYAYVYGPAIVPLPEITVEQPVGTNIEDGGTKSFGAVIVGSVTNLTFTIKNIGTADLTLSGEPKAVISGPDAASFTVTAQPSSPVSSLTGSTQFTVRFSPSTSGVKSATLSLSNDDSNEGPFDINLTGTSLSFTNDTDGDGINDAAELQMASLGFDWQQSQNSLVSTYYANANSTGLYTTSQLQALNVGSPLLTKNPTTGKFVLTIGVQRTTNLGTTPFTDFPFGVSGTTTTINGAGKLEFEFPASGNAEFFRVGSE